MTKEIKETKSLPIRALSAIIDRLGLANSLGMQFGGKRDLYKVYGYSQVVTFNDYLNRYKRQDIAKRIVNAPADATWKNPPKIKGDEALETAWGTLATRLKLWGVITRADRMAGIGEYSVILLGFDDGKDLSKPVVKGKNTLLYAQPYMQCDAIISKLDNDPTSERFGLPTEYTLKLTDPLKAIDIMMSMGSVGTTQLPSMSTTVTTIDQKVHYTRIVHIAEDTLSNNFLGTPRLQGVYNLLDDLLKVVGGTAETYWLTSNRGMQADIDKDAELTTADAEALSDEIDEYSHDLRRFIRTRGVTIRPLGASSPDPKNTFGMLVSLVAAATGIPQRILLGAEAGQLASDQDRANWADKIKERRNIFAEPYVLRPLVQSLMNAGVLPLEDITKIDFMWPANFELTPLEQAQTMAQRARAIINLSKSFIDGSPLCTFEEAREIVGLNAEIPAGQTLPKQVASPTGSGVNGAASNFDPQDNTDNGTRQEIISENQ